MEKISFTLKKSVFITALFIVLASFIFLLSCTISIIQTDTHGTAEDVVDSTPTTTTETDADLSIPIPIP